MNEEVKTYFCTDKFENFDLGFSKHFSETINNIVEISDEYEAFVERLEGFFNSQLESKEALDELDGEVFELSDSNEKVYFPFKKIDDHLKFVETDTWRTIIMSSIILKNIKKSYFEIKEQYND